MLYILKSIYMKQLFGDILHIENKNSIIIFPTFTSETLLASVNNYVQEYTSMNGSL